MDRLEELQTRLEKLAREMGNVQTRLGMLEERLEPASLERWKRLTAPEAETAETSKPVASEAPISAGTVSLVGRSLMVLAGAYLLRAITESGSIPALAGVAAGLAYAVWWLVSSDRAAGSGKRFSAGFHGFVALIIAYPLIAEATTRLGVLSGATGASLIVVFFALGLAAAWRRDLVEVSWANTLLAVVTTLGLFGATHDLMPFTLALLAIAGILEVLANQDRWLGLRWPVALGLDAAVLVMVDIVSRPGGPPEGYAPISTAGAIAVGLVLPGLYLGSLVTRTLIGRRHVRPFGMIQTATALLIGVGGALKVSASSGTSTTAISVMLLLLGATSYAAAFAFMGRRAGRGRNFYFYTTFAVVLTLVGCAMVFRGPGLALLWCLLSITALSLGGRFDRITLKFHGVVYLAAAATEAGLLASAYDGLLAGSTDSWRTVSSVGFVVAVAAAVGYGILVSTRKGDAKWSALLPQAIVGGLATWIFAGIAAGWLAGVLAGAPGPESDAAFMATSRTAVISVLAVALAWAARKWSLRELTWLVYPLLVGGGIRLLLEDIRFGRPVTLFFTLALYGSALILTPRLIKKAV